MFSVIVYTAAEMFSVWYKNKKVPIGLKIATFAEKMNIPRLWLMYFFLLSWQWSHIERLLFFKKWLFNMSKIYQIIDITGQYETPNRRGNEEPTEVLIFNLSSSFSIDFTKTCVIFVFVARHSRNLNNLELPPPLFFFHAYMKQNYFL